MPAIRDTQATAKKCALFLLILFSLIQNLACNPKEKHQDSVVQSAGTTQFSRWLWPDVSHVQVCWEKIDPIHLKLASHQPKPGEIEDFKQQIKTRATEEFARVPIHLVGWNECTPSNPGIHILINGTSDIEVRGFGRHLDGMYAGVLLRYPSSLSIAEKYLMSLPLHELGHVFGLRHEQARIEALRSCASATEEAREDRLFGIGPYDPDSIMNYCQREGLGAMKSDSDLAHFSKGDIAALQGMYFGVVAELALLPGVIGVTKFKTQVRGVESYRYKYGPFASTRCHEETGYSAEQLARDDLIIDSEPSSVQQIKICVLGKKDDKWQDLYAASEYPANVATKEVFADYRVPELDAPFEMKLPLNPDNSTDNLKAVWTKVLFPDRDGTNGSFSCSDPKGYEVLPDMNMITLPPTERLFTEAWICVAAEDQSGRPIDFNNAHSITFFGLGSFKVIFDPFSTFKEKAKMLLIQDNAFQVFEKISYWFGAGRKCGTSGWQEINAMDTIAIDVTEIPKSESLVTLCAKRKPLNSAWENYGTSLRSWSR